MAGRRHQRTSTYEMPKDEGSPLGICSADLTMTLTTLYNHPIEDKQRLLHYVVTYETAFDGIV